MEKDFYTVLGVAKTASRKEIEDAFNRLALQYHPDRNGFPEAEERFKEVSEAYSVLSDPEKRALYDALGPEKYDDPREVLKYQLNQEAAKREMKREYQAWKSAQQDDIAQTTGTLIFFLVLLNLIPSWVLSTGYSTASSCSPWPYPLTSGLTFDGFSGCAGCGEASMHGG